MCIDFLDTDVNGFVNGWAVRTNRRAFLSILLGKIKITLLGGIEDNCFELEELLSIFKDHFQVFYTSDKFRFENSTVNYCLIQRIKNSIKFIEISSNVSKCLQSCSIKDIFNIQRVEPRSKDFPQQLRIPLIFYREKVKESFILTTRSKTKFHKLRSFVNRLNPKGEISNDKPTWIDYSINIKNRLSETELSIEFENSESYEQQKSSDSYGISQTKRQTISIENTNSNGSEIPPEYDGR